MKTSTIILAFIVVQSCFIFAQTPCTNEMAYQTVGKWGKPKTDDLAMADRSFPKTQYPSVLAKANQVIELFKLSNPEFKGIEARAYRGIRGNSLLPNGALPFRVDVGLFEYYCVPSKGYIPEIAGKIRLGTESGTWVYFYFNSFGWVLEGVEGDENLFYAPKPLGNLKGFSLFQPSGGRLDVKQEAVIITPNTRLPYKPVSQSKNGKAVVALDKEFFNPKLPRSAIQFITVYWGWDDKNLVTKEAIREFKQNFDFEALKQMIGK